MIEVPILNGFGLVGWIFDKAGMIVSIFLMRIWLESLPLQLLMHGRIRSLL